MYGFREKMMTTIGCEFCGASFGAEHEETCPVFSAKQKKKQKKQSGD